MFVIKKLLNVNLGSFFKSETSHSNTEKKTDQLKDKTPSMTSENSLEDLETIQIKLGSLEDQIRLLDLQVQQSQFIIIEKQSLLNISFDDLNNLYFILSTLKTVNPDEEIEKKVKKYEMKKDDLLEQIELSVVMIDNLKIEIADQEEKLTTLKKEFSRLSETQKIIVKTNSILSISDEYEKLEKIEECLQKILKETFLAIKESDAPEVLSQSLQKYATTNALNALESETYLSNQTLKDWKRKNSFRFIDENNKPLSEAKFLPDIQNLDSEEGLQMVETFNKQQIQEINSFLHSENDLKWFNALQSVLNQRTTEVCCSNFRGMAKLVAMDYPVNKNETLRFKDFDRFIYDIKVVRNENLEIEKIEIFCEMPFDVCIVENAGITALEKEKIIQEKVVICKLAYSLRLDDNNLPLIGNLSREISFNN